jgi:uncharacterized phage protein gp47/JayE
VPDIPSRIELFNVGADEILARSASRPAAQRIDPTQVFTEGSDINVVTASASAMAEEVLRQLALRVNALFLAGAKGEDLDRLVGDRFSPTVVRKAATPAVTNLTLSRPSGAAIVTLAVGTKVKTSGGVEFETTAVVSLGAGDLGPETVAAEAVLAGTAGNVAANTLTQFSSPPSDSGLLVTNLETAAGGDDTESDERLRERARDFFRQARRGTVAAIEFGALTVAGVRLATAVELVDTLGNPTGHVELYISDSQGNGNALLVSAVRDALFEYRAAGVVVNVIAATPVYQAIQYRLRFEAGTDSTAAFELIRLTTVSAVNALRPVQTLTRAQLFSIARSVPGVIVLSDAIVTPVGDVVPAAGEVIRTRVDLVTSA